MTLDHSETETPMYDDKNVLNAHFSYPNSHEPMALIFNRGYRYDPIAPYVVTDDPGDCERTPRVDLAVPGQAEHTIGVLLRFTSLEAIDALMGGLQEARTRLAERYAENAADASF